jgi:hypothetical protein
LRGLLDALVFSSLWVAAAAAALCAAAARALAAPPDPAVLGLAFCGTLVVYDVDRLRDLERDRETSPLRSAFVARHRGALVALTAAAASGSAVFAMAVGWLVLPLLAPVLALGLLHRRLKHFGLAKPLYITAAWLLVVVGLPALRAPDPALAAGVACALGPAILANAIASNARDDEAVSARLGQRVPLHLARGCALLGVAVALSGSQALRVLAPAPLLTFAALVPFRADERYGHWVVDGALLAGGLASAAWGGV